MSLFILFILINTLLAYIDLQYGLLPFGLCLILSLITAGHCEASALFMRGLFVLVYLGTLQYGYEKLRGIEGLGHGDIALCLAYCSWFPLHVLLFIIALASLLAVALNRNNKAQTFPFGPYLCFAAVICLLLT